MGSFGGSRKGAAGQSASVSEAIPARHRVQSCAEEREPLDGGLWRTGVQSLR
ncbi:hypothetical protein GQ607_013746 [Colletotrichum asianum]|uniref:Uncharacterized protein n=1 Tax=Colletotrichum asianum TaxID=702518 RepID=A0A8H3W3A1_9PEZI|nr:hypothetical protein GQ607_013746 [Colletotrichum asianum]